MSTDTQYRERFKREADLAATLQHPHIVGVHDRGEFAGQLWISMDYIDGTDAGRRLRDRYPSGMPRREVVEIVSAVADALDYAHECGLLHRDVKPANILLTKPDTAHRRVLLGDFGIARSLNDVGGLTPRTATVGTIGYAAPEQLEGGSLDGRADQYALAATTYHLLTGSLPFEHLFNETLPSLATRRPDLAGLDAVLAVALAKGSKGPFSTVRGFRANWHSVAAPSMAPVPVTAWKHSRFP